MKMEIKNIARLGKIKFFKFMVLYMKHFANAMRMRFMEIGGNTDSQDSEKNAKISFVKVLPDINVLEVIVVLFNIFV